MSRRSARTAAKAAEPEETGIFAGKTFALAGSKAQSEDLHNAIEEHGGAVQATVTKKVDYVVVPDASDFTKTKVTSAQKNSIPLVLATFVTASVKAKALEDPAKHPFTEGASATTAMEADEPPAAGPAGKRAATKAKGASAKKTRVADDEEETEVGPATSSTAATSTTTTTTTTTTTSSKVEEPTIRTERVVKKGRGVVDKLCPKAASVHVYEDGAGVLYDAMLNQTDVAFGVKGHNKFYVIQMLQTDGAPNVCYVWTRWGRVGVPGQNGLAGPFDVAAGINSFKAKWADKTKNAWAAFLDRSKFKTVKDKYTPVEVATGDDDGDGEDEEKKAAAKKAEAARTSTSKLDRRVQTLVSMLFDMKMFDQTLLELKIDVKKMPLGQLSKAQIKRGFEQLEGLEKEMAKASPNRERMTEFINAFYSNIPHDFGFSKPPRIDSPELLKQKYDLLQTLGDMEVAVSIMKDEKKEVDLSPLDAKYAGLKCDIAPLDRDSTEWKYIETYLGNTVESPKLTILDIYRVERHGEKELFKKFDAIENRQLLWHGSRVAVFSAILSTGLKIMPHAGGRVGKGLYFADIVSKSAGYCGVMPSTEGLMLLNEVVLGKHHEITRDDSSLVRPPAGFDSVLARGRIAPDPAQHIKDTKLSPSGHPVIVPQGKNTASGVGSSFQHDEWLVYNQEMASMRYLLRLRWEPR